MLRSEVAALLFLLAGCSCSGGASGEGDGGRDAGQDSGVDAGWDAGFDAGPWIPEAPRRVELHEDVTCDAVEPAADGAPPPVSEGEVPRLLWYLRPFQDEAAVPELLALDYRMAFVASLPPTLMDDGDFVFSVSGFGHYAVDSTGAFDWVIGPEGGIPEVAAASGIGDRLITTYGVGFLTRRTGTSGRSSIAGVLLDIPSWDGDAVKRSPLAVARTGEVVAAAGADRLIGGCVGQSEIRWMVEYDASRLGDYWSRFTYLLDDGSVVFAPTGPDLYRFDRDGELMRSHTPGDGSYRSVLGLVPGCGFATLTSRREGDRYIPVMEWYSEDLERVSSFEFAHFAGARWHYAAMPDCGLAYHAEIEEDRGVEAFEGIIRVDAEGGELWRYPVHSAELRPPMIPLADGGLLVVDSGPGQRLTYLSSAGEVVWRYDVNSGLPTRTGASVEFTGLLAPNGVFYLGLDADAGGSFWIIAVATGLTPAPMAWEASAGNPRRTSHESWE